MISLNADMRSYQPINSYGVIGDCRSAVLVAPDGSVDWGCLPDFDSPAIFCRLLDAEYGGYFRIAPTDSLIDRKSTRLNSSHSQISYAVFCLKKKKCTDLAEASAQPLLDLNHRHYAQGSDVS